MAMDFATLSGINVNVDYYNHEHKQKLGQSPYPAGAIARMKDLVSNNPLHIPMGDFLTYAMFRDQGTGPPKFKNLESMRSWCPQFAGRLGDFFAFDNDTLTSKPHHDPRPGDTEAIGAAIGLSVISRILGLTLADWHRIPQLQVKHLDFELASDSQRAIQVEVKGRCVENNLKKAPSVSEAAREILGQKSAAEERTLRADDDFPAMIRYGSIAAIDEKNIAKCWLLDPPAVQEPWIPDDLRVLKRMNFIAHWLRLLVPYAALTRALNARLSEIRESKLSDFNNRALDDVPIVPSTEFSQADPSTRTGLFRGVRGKAVVLNDYYAGLLISPTPKQASESERTVFIGIHQDLLEIARAQDFDRLIEYRSEPQRKEVIVESGTLDSLVQTNMHLHVSTSGLAIGLIARPTDTAGS